MSGMITTVGNSLSSYGSRTVAIEVTGVCRQDVMRTSNYTVKVPYSRMSQTIKNISRMGGKIANISLGNTAVKEVVDADADTPKPAPQQKRRSGGKKNRNR